jgi:hypothetical protein
MVTAGIGGTGSQEDLVINLLFNERFIISDLAEVGSSYNRFVGLANYIWTDNTLNF